MKEKEFNQYISQIRPRLIAFASTFSVTGVLEAEDMVQEAIFKLWKEVLKEKDIRSYDAFMIIALKNVCLDYLRRVEHTVNQTVDHKIQIQVNSNPESEFVIKETVQNVEQIMQTLPPEQQILLRLRDIMGYDFAEIAEVLEITEVNARALLSRARKRIREVLLKHK